MIEIIPAIDIIDGSCVRLSQGDYDKKTTYYKDPVDAAKRFEETGLHRLHIVDLDGAKASTPKNLAVLERIASATNMSIQYGGGIKSEESVRSVLNSGAKKAICGSIAITEPEAFISWMEKFGTEAIILGADIKNGKIATHGWLETSETTVEQLVAYFQNYGISQVICTDISKDGMLEGPNFELYYNLQHQFPQIDITVSGGISSIDDIKTLEQKDLKSVIVGKAVYEGRISYADLTTLVNMGIAK